MRYDAPFQVSGYVLAGGRSSRIGTDKALLQLAGKPLIEHAVAKLRLVCTDVHILSRNPALAPYAPLVPDLHPDCGPIGGMEAALLNSTQDWNLILPVDLPFIPTLFLQRHAADNATLAPSVFRRIEMFIVSDRPQPALCFLHKELAPYISSAIESGDFKLMTVLEAAANALAIKHNKPLRQVFQQTPITGALDLSRKPSEDGQTLSPGAKDSDIRLWFTNLNTPEDFRHAQKHVDALNI